MESTPNRLETLQKALAALVARWSNVPDLPDYVQLLLEELRVASGVPQCEAVDDETDWGSGLRCERIAGHDGFHAAHTGGLTQWTSLGPTGARFDGAHA